jgi:peptidoglycan/xylan/chitin deacetylase (PgdA/CDA1 family)
MTSRLLAVIVVATISPAGPMMSEARAAEDAVILMYHHVDSTTPPATSITPEKFTAHLDYLARENFTVLPLLEVLRSIEAGNQLPEKTVVLTFDDGYDSVYETALPLLSDRGWPFTVFVSTDYIDGGFGSYLTWDQLRELAANGATLGNHTRTHAHLVRQAADESMDEWRQRVEEEISGAGERLAAELGDAAIPVLAYPYGEYDTTVKEITETLGLLALGQHSGAIGPHSDLLAGPRYPLATGYDELVDFSLRVYSHALPASPLDDESHVLDENDVRPTLRLEILPGDFRVTELACYATGQGVMDLTWEGDDQRIVSVRPRLPINAGRTKFNCTAPSASENGIYYWYSYLWIKKNDDGTWPEE